MRRPEALEAIGSEMEDAVHRGDVVGYATSTRRLHSLIHRISGQRTALPVIERLRGQSVRQQYRRAMKPGRPSVSVLEHGAIIDAITSGDREAAEKAMADHLDSVMKAMHDVNAEAIPRDTQSR